MKNLPDLEAWAVFAKVAESGSFSRAADALSITQATVSKAITRLEARIGTALFHRTSRHLSLTETGEAALERASRILQEGEAIELEVAEQSTSLRGPIRIAVPMSFGVSRVAPLLPAFMQAHPDVELDLHFSDEAVDLVSNRFDLALRISNLSDSSLLVRRIGTVRIVLAGSPAYFKEHGEPKHPRDLLQHRALLYTYSQNGTNWRFKHQQHGEFSQAMRGHVYANNADALVPTLRAGLGIALLPIFLACEDLLAGNLQTTMDEWQIEPLSLQVITPPGRRRPARVDAFIDYLIKGFSNAAWSQAPLADAATHKHVS